MISLNLEGKVSIVTGGSRGIGKSIALKLAQAGSTVAIFDILEKEGKDTAEQVVSSGGKADFYRVNVTSEEDIKIAVGRVLENYGKVDFLINNAGITSRYSFTELSFDVWKKTIDVNLTGAFLCCREVIPSMIKQKSGRIVFISSASSITGSGGGAHYASSKGGINSLVRALARELAEYNILVNAVAPRNIEAETLDDIYTKEQIEALCKKIPLRRLGKPEEVAGVVLFLCSSFSTYITGQIIIVDGGRTFGT